jgi:hypothetical protein
MRLPAWLSARSLTRYFRTRQYAYLHDELHKLRDSTLTEFARLRADLEVELGRLDKHLSAEQSRLHALVTQVIAKHVAYINNELYYLKRNIYHPDMVEELRGLNGQFSKHLIFRELSVVCRFEALIETGTYFGETTELLGSTGRPVYSVEANRSFYDVAECRFRNRSNVHLVFGDSPEFLRNLTAHVLASDALVFVYLDAHWHEHLPLSEELHILAAHHPYAVVMVDDFKVEDDRDYGYDTYADGQEITLSFLDPEIRANSWEVFFPSLCGRRDHMTCDILLPRGTAVLACHQEVIAKLRGLHQLRHWPLHGVSHKPSKSAP